MNVNGPIDGRKPMEPTDHDLEPDERIVLYSIGALRNTPLGSKVKLQKILFLVTEVFPEWDELLEYESHLLGPYSERVDNILEDLLALGLISRSKSNYILTREGLTVFNDLRPKPQLVKVLEDFKEFLNDLPDEQVLTFIYVFYPQYTSESARWEKLKKDRVRNAIAMLSRGKISFSKAAEVAGMGPDEFSALLERRGVRWREA